MSVETRTEKDLLGAMAIPHHAYYGIHTQRAKVLMPAVDHTIINRYPSIQCRYENFRSQTTIRPTCWYKD